MNSGNSTSSDVLIIGGGIQGVAASLNIAQSGLSCRLIERDRVGAHASGVNAGGIRRLGRHPAELPVSQLAWKLWKSAEERLEDDCGLKWTGQAFVAQTDKDMESFRERLRVIQRLGYTHEEVIGAPEMRDWVPGLAHDIRGALVTRTDGQANPYRAVTAHRRAAEHAGVKFQEGEQVISLTRNASNWDVSTNSGRYSAPLVVNCAGAWGATVASWAGDQVPFRTAAPMMMVTAPAPPLLGPVLGRAAGRLSLKQGANGTIIIGGGQKARLDTTGNRAEVDVLNVAAGVATAVSILPDLAKHTLVRAWYGIEGYLPDGLPIISPSTASEGLFHAFGFSGHGFQLGPGVGQLVCEMVREAPTSVDIDPFRISRFNSTVAPPRIWISAGVQQR